MTMCLDRHREQMPGSLALMDHLLAQDLRDQQASSVQALNAFLDFRRQVIYVIALGPDAREAGAALRALVANRDGFSGELQRLIAEALRRSDGPAPAGSAAASDSQAQPGVK
jgi:hypothetical protein